MFQDPISPPSNPATDGVARMCGDNAPMLLTFATLGVSIAMGTAVALILTRRGDVARVTSAVNLALTALVISIAIRQGPACVPIGAMAASLPGLMGVVAFAASFLRAPRKSDGPDADSG